MATILQLNPQIPVNTPKGPGQAIGWMDFYEDEYLMWIIFLDSNGQCWTFPNPEIRARTNPTMGRKL